MKPAKTYNYNGPYHDDRKGLGYGQVKNKFHKPRKASSSYPYMIDDFDDEGFDDEESLKAIKQKNPDLYVTDFGAAAKTDPFYFAAGNVKLSDAYFRTEALIEEMKTFSDSMSPAPHKYKGKGPGLGRASGSSFPSGVGSYNIIFDKLVADHAQETYSQLASGVIGAANTKVGIQGVTTNKGLADKIVAAIN